MVFFFNFVAAIPSLLFFFFCYGVVEVIYNYVEADQAMGFTKCVKAAG